MTTTAVVEQHGADLSVVAASSSISEPVTGAPSADRYLDEDAPTRVDRP